MNGKLCWGIMLFLLSVTTAQGQTPRASTLRWPGGITSPHPAVVRIYVAEGKSQSLGSGTLIDVRDKYGLVITNWHVIRDAVGEISVVFPDGFRSAARVVHFDKDWDLAALSIWRPQATPVAVALELPKPGDMLTIAGYGSEGQYRAVSGACTQYLAPSDKHPYELVELAATARQGDSGGPIFNARGELAGVLFGSVKGTTTGSYGGRVWKFVEPLLRPNAAITAPEKPTLVAPPVTAQKPVPAMIEMDQAPAANASAEASPARPAAPLEAIAQETSDTDTPSAATSTTGALTPTPFPYREASGSFHESGFSQTGDLNLQNFLGHSPMEQVKAVFAIIGMCTVLGWLMRWNQPQPVPAGKH